MHYLEYDKIERYPAGPHSQNKPDGATNRAVLNENNICIVKVEKINHEL